LISFEKTMWMLCVLHMHTYDYGGYEQQIQDVQHLY
jgi:hypothetical protein